MRQHSWRFELWHLAGFTLRTGCILTSFEGSEGSLALSLFLSSLRLPSGLAICQLGRHSRLSALLETSCQAHLVDLLRTAFLSLRFGCLGSWRKFFLLSTGLLPCLLSSGLSCVVLGRTQMEWLVWSRPLSSHFVAWRSIPQSFFP